MEQENKEQTQSTAIFMAVPFGEELSPVDRQHDDEEFCLESDTMNDGLEDVIRSCKIHSSILGLVIGTFVQLSSMGAFYLYTAFHSVSISAESPIMDRALFSVGWAVFTSALGVLLMFVTTLFFLPEHSKLSDTEDGFLRHVECYIGTGAVVGVSVSWIVKNIWLGNAFDLWQTIALAVVAYVYSKVARCLLMKSDDEESDDQLVEPLLSEKTESSPRSYKGLSITLGLLVGWLIQLSSLGANFWLAYSFNENSYGPGDEQERRKQILTFTLVYSLVTSSLGMIVLLALRRLLSMFWCLSSCGEKGNDNSLSNIEWYFSLGAFLGVNIAWCLSDLLSGTNTWEFVALWDWLKAIW